MRYSSNSAAAKSRAGKETGWAQKPTKLGLGDLWTFLNHSKISQRCHLHGHCFAPRGFGVQVPKCRGLDHPAQIHGSPSRSCRVSGSIPKAFTGPINWGNSRHGKGQVGTGFHWEGVEAPQDLILEKLIFTLGPTFQLLTSA